LQIRGLTVCYRSHGGNPVRALDRVNLEIRSGEVVGLLGESGCGKSTLAAAILRLLPSRVSYYEGQVLFDGRDLLRLSERELCHIRGKCISLIWQDPALTLNPVISVGDQIAEVLRAHGRPRRRAYVMESLAEVGFTKPAEVYRAYPHQLSGGERQRIVIAQAVACRPALVIADEATSKLDTALQNDILTLLGQIRRRHHTAFLLISHDPGVFTGFADRIAVMYAGRLVEEAGAENLLQTPLHPYTQALVRLHASTVIAASSQRRRLPAIEGETPDLSMNVPGCRFEPRCADRLPVCASCDPQDSTQGRRHVSCFQYAE
jgi:peptide/nickel transport system ATP-binding protein